MELSHGQNGNLPTKCVGTLVGPGKNLTEGKMKGAIRETRQTER